MFLALGWECQRIPSTTCADLSWLRTKSSTPVTDIRLVAYLSMGTIQELAADLGAEERTLRRAASQGTLRASRPGSRRLRLAPGEREYLGIYWPLLSELRRTLRTEHGVRLAVLYGSLARGDEDEDSDLISSSRFPRTTSRPD